MLYCASIATSGAIRSPDNAGRAIHTASYVVELDVVWEGVTWLSQRGLRTIAVNLRVE